MFKHCLGVWLMVFWGQAAAAGAAVEVVNGAADEPVLRVAFLADAHFHDVYGQFKDGAFAGLSSGPKDKPVVIRSMSAQLNSTRLFNENYFALLAALDDMVARGIKLVALPGDFSDDGQPLHVRGLAQILSHYSKRYGMQFFATNGNHDPVRPYTSAGGEADFLGPQGQELAIYSHNSAACKAAQPATNPLSASHKTTLCSDDMLHLGYQGLLSLLGDAGFYPQPNYLYWESPYSTYQSQPYDFKLAAQQADLALRHYEICKQGTGGRYKQAHYTDCQQLADSSYLVEPVAGLWLLAIDANVYVPQSGTEPRFSGSGNAGYNLMFSHKTQVIEWIKSVVERAEQQGKVLLSFSHFPMGEFYDGQSDFIARTFGDKQFQLARRPRDEISTSLAKLGLKVHVGGHMHMNDTSVVHDDSGQFLVNIQAPSIAAYVPAYKLLTVHGNQQLEVETIELDEVAGFNRLFSHYQREYDYLLAHNSPKLWDKNILQARNYREFSNWHIRELTRQRFLPQEWPQDLRLGLFGLSGADLAVLSQFDSDLNFTQLQAQGGFDKLKQSPAWQAAALSARQLAKSAGISLHDLATWDSFELAVDFYRLRNAGSLAFNDISLQRLSQYHWLGTLLKAERAVPQAMTAEQFEQQAFTDLLRQRLAQVFALLRGFEHGQADKHFRLDLISGEISSLASSD